MFFVFFTLNCSLEQFKDFLCRNSRVDNTWHIVEYIHLTSGLMLLIQVLPSYTSILLFDHLSSRWFLKLSVVWAAMVSGSNLFQRLATWLVRKWARCHFEEKCLDNFKLCPLVQESWDARGRRPGTAFELISLWTRMASPCLLLETRVGSFSLHSLVG